MNLATKGANFHPTSPISTKVYSNGSMGSSFVYALYKNTSPKIVLNKKNKIVLSFNLEFITIIYQKKSYP
jgi:hypothetical protein